MEGKPKTNNVLLLFILSLAIVGCNKSTPPVANSDCELPQLQEFAEDGSTDIRECILPEQEPGANLDVNATLRDFTPEQELKMREALKRLKIVINSTAFKERVLNHTYQGVRTFYDNEGLTNEEIYEAIMLGSEDLNPGDNETIDIDITLYFRNNSTVGYTYPNVNKIWVNNKFFAGFSLGKVAANVAHEWTHKIGFGHDFNRTTRRNFSVPYGVGTIIQELVDGL
jgi:hypothetical protein